MNETIHRRSNGTIDIDFYRSQAARERRVLRTIHARQLGRTLQRAAAATWRWLTPPVRPMPDAGAVMLISDAAARRPGL